MSADSGLAVYNQIADVPAYHKAKLTYADLCVPDWFYKDKEIFYGFWGKCFNDYRESSPHKGYKILHDIVKEHFSNIAQIELLVQIAKTEDRKKELSETLDPKPRYFIFTSNVDSHFIATGFPKERVEEIHGSCSQWYCSKLCPEAKHPEVWDLPESFRFDVNLESMRMNNLVNCPKCPHCKSFARPHVLMFSDYDWIGKRKTGYSKWRREVSESNSKLVIIEIGCGKRVPTVRKESESIVKELGKREQVKLIRINPDFPECKYGHTISIKAGALDTLSKIYRCILTKDIWLNQNQKTKPPQNT